MLDMVRLKNLRKESPVSVLRFFQFSERKPGRQMREWLMIERYLSDGSPDFLCLLNSDVNLWHILASLATCFVSAVYVCGCFLHSTSMRRCAKRLKLR